MSCSVCGKYGPLTLHHRVPKGWKKNGKRSRSWNPDTSSNLVVVCWDCHEEYHIIVHQQPYEGNDSFKQQAVARNVSKLLGKDQRFKAMLPRYAVSYYNRWKKEI